MLHVVMHVVCLSAKYLNEISRACMLCLCALLSADQLVVIPWPRLAGDQRGAPGQS